MVADTQLDEIEQRIEGLRERLDSCRQAMSLSRAAIWVGGGVLALVLTFAVNYRTPAIVFGAISAVLGGTVWFGANKTSRRMSSASWPMPRRARPSFLTRWRRATVGAT